MCLKNYIKGTTLKHRGGGQPGLVKDHTFPLKETLDKLLWYLKIVSEPNYANDNICISSTI